MIADCDLATRSQTSRRRVIIGTNNQAQGSSATRRQDQARSLLALFALGQRGDERHG